MTHRAQVLVGDVRERLSDLSSGSVRCCVTSPPYWNLRDYGVSGQIGLEPTSEEFVDTLVSVFRLVHRVLADDGTLWLNLGDSYAGRAGGNDGHHAGLRRWRGGGRTRKKPAPRISREADPALGAKNLCGIPWRVALALQADGWILRRDIIWHKPNPMPESVKDRPTTAHEYVFLLAKREGYFYDGDAIKEPVTGRAHPRGAGVNPKASVSAPGSRQNASFSAAVKDTVDFRNKRSVWRVHPQPYADAHFAVMPEALVEPCILAGSARDDVVLDPFSGTGTVGVVALQHVRRFIGIELNPEYAQMARARLAEVTDAPRLFTPTGDIYDG